MTTVSGNRGRAALAIVSLIFCAALVIDDTVAAWALRCRAPVLDLLVGIINPIGSGVTLLVACVALAILSRALRRTWLQNAASLGALAFTAAGIAEFTVKHVVGRPRPDAALASAALLGPSFAHDIDSFPSGHATSVFAVATVFAAYYPRLRWPLYAVAAAIALGRVYLERHYVSDIVAGSALGITVATTLYHHRHPAPGGMTAEQSADSYC
jgi:membrane-associated phospholipid phosphatase